MSKLPTKAAKKGGHTQEQDKPKNAADAGGVGLAAGGEGAEPDGAHKVPGEGAEHACEKDPAEDGLEAVGQAHAPEPTPAAATESAPAELNDVEQVRKSIVRGQITALTRLRGYLSLTRGNQAAVDRLHGRSGNLICAKVSDLILRELGHTTDTPIEDGNNPIRRLLPTRHRVG